MKRRFAIAGAGVVGRLLALKLSELDCEVTLFDRGLAKSERAASFAAAGMLAPWSEMDMAEKEVHALGVESLGLWPELFRRFELDVFWQRSGTVVVTEGSDVGLLERLERRLHKNTGTPPPPRLDRSEIARLEPELEEIFSIGLFFPQEGQVDARNLLSEMGRALHLRPNVGQVLAEVESVEPNVIRTRSGAQYFDIVFDCRGLGAKSAFPDLHAVRGEMLLVHAPDVSITRPVRVLHARTPLYIVPRPNNLYLLGATMIEAEDASSISVRSTLELLSTAFGLCSGFAEARILETIVGLRPTLASHAPKILRTEGLVRINGMYRHGFMTAPRIVELACQNL